MAARTPSRWSGKQPDERRRERRDLLLDTAYELLGTAGAAGTTVRGVCEAARLNPRYFYESFADLDELLVAVYDRAAVEAMTVMRGAQEAASDDPSHAAGRWSARWWRTSSTIRAGRGCCTWRAWATRRWPAGAWRRCAVWRQASCARPPSSSPTTGVWTRSSRSRRR
ncbi:MAG: TetR family transcriptional regulator [Acidimicrobiales bacterium]